MARLPQDGLTEREGQIMNVLWEQNESTVEEIRAQLPTDLASSTIRTLLAIMEDKGYVRFRKEGRAKVFRPRVQRETAQRSALVSLKERLFQGSAGLLLARLVEEEELSDADLARLRELIDSNGREAS